MPEATNGQAPIRPVRSWDSAGAIYGTIAAMAVIAGGSRTTDVAHLLVVTLATLGVFWLTHVYADALAHHLRGAQRLGWAAIRAAMIDEWPLITGPLPCLVILTLTALEVFQSERGVRLALWCGVVQLLVWGVTLARRLRWGWPTACTAGLLNAFFGLAIVALEVFIH